MVSGVVRAADGTARPNVKVVVAHPRSNLSETVFTDGSGRYSALLHMHDKDAGDPVTVTAGDETQTIKADYDPKDHSTPRVVSVDFGPAAPADTSSALWWYGLGGAALAGGALYWRLRASRSRRAGKRAGRAARGKGKSHA